MVSYLVIEILVENQKTIVQPARLHDGFLGCC